MSTPQSSIYMCAGVPLTNTYDHTILFNSPEAQQEYFQSKVWTSFTEYSYVRRTWNLKVQARYETAREWSYVFFRNGTGKYYYYFINHAEYINDNAVELYLEMDVLQTYMFDWRLRPCFVEREHSATDNIGENTVDEGLTVGEYTTYHRETIDLSTDLSIMTAASIDINAFYLSSGETEDKVFGSKYGNIFGGFQITATPLNPWWDDLAVMLNYLSTKGKIDTVFTMWQYPTRLLKTDYGSFEFCIAPYVKGTETINFTAFSDYASLGGYAPKNKKLLQYPYRYIYATNNNGGAAVYKYEKFKDGTPTFKVEGNIAPDAVVKLTPLNYKNVDVNNDESLAMTNFPVCSWNNDTYKMWLAQNANQQNLGLAMSGLKIVGGVGAIVGGAIATGATGGAAGALGIAGVSSGIGLISSGATGIASQLAQRADMEIQPPQSRGTISGSHNVSCGLQNFDFYHRTIDAYHAEMLDNYFTMYGYACRKVKVPNISARPRWNYVKTIGSNVTGNICNEDIKLINSIFDKGVTFWKIDVIGSYTLDNAPIQEG